jgi:hypothetical protein
MEPIYTEGEAQAGNAPINQSPKDQDVVWFERQPTRNPQSLRRLKEDSLEGFASEPEEPGGERFGFLKISAIRETGPERVEVELELTPAAAREPIDLESLGLRDIQISTRESKSGGRSVWLTGSGDFFGSVGDTVRLLPMSGIKREPRRKVYWRKTYLIDVFTRDTGSQTGIDLPETTQQYIVDLASRSASDQCRYGDPGDSHRAKSAAQCKASEFMLKTGGTQQQLVVGRCSLLLREPVTDVADHERERIRVRAR